jgi:hypothetical protein
MVQKEYTMPTNEPNEYRMKNPRSEIAQKVENYEKDEINCIPRQLIKKLVQLTLSI